MKSPFPTAAVGRASQEEPFVPSGPGGGQAQPEHSITGPSPDGLLASLLSSVVTCFAWPHRSVY